MMNPCVKKCYERKKDALTAKNALYHGTRRNKRRRMSLPKRLKVYFCPECAAWHLATKRK